MKKSILVSFALSLASGIVSASWSIAPNGVTVKCPGESGGSQNTINGQLYTVASDRIHARNIETDHFTDPVSNPSRACVTNLTNIAFAFQFQHEFNGDISDWDVSNVTTMYKTFKNATNFNGDLSHWNTQSLTDMYSIFDGASNFNSDIGSWDVSNVSEFSKAFLKATRFNQSLSDWDVSNAIELTSMFAHTTSYSDDLSKWCAPKITAVPRSFLFENSGSVKPPYWPNCSTIESQSEPETPQMPQFPPYFPIMFNEKENRVLIVDTNMVDGTALEYNLSNGSKTIYQYQDMNALMQDLTNNDNWVNVDSNPNTSEDSSFTYSDGSPVEWDKYLFSGSDSGSEEITINSLDDIFSIIPEDADDYFYSAHFRVKIVDVYAPISSGGGGHTDLETDCDPELEVCSNDPITDVPDAGYDPSPMYLPLPAE